MKERDISIDILKGIGILFMLSAHSLGGYVHSFAYSFHMPLFFIISGYFFRIRGITECVKGNARRLLWPLVFTTLLMLTISVMESLWRVENVKSPSEVLEMLLYANGSSHNYHKIWGDFSCIGSPWFLGCLFWAKIIYNALHHISMTFIRLGVLSFLLSVLSVIFGQFIVLPYSLLQGISVLPFLWIGEYVKKESFSTIMFTGKTRWLMWVFVIGWMVSTFFDVLSIAGFKWEWYVIPNIFFASAGVGVMYQISKSIMKLPYISKFLSFLGEYSLVFVCFPVIESYFIPLKEIIPNMSFRLEFILMVKVLWAIMCLLLVVKIPFVRNIFGVRTINFRNLW